MISLLDRKKISEIVLDMAESSKIVGTQKYFIHVWFCPIPPGIYQPLKKQYQKYY